MRGLLACHRWRDTECGSNCRGKGIFALALPIVREAFLSLILMQEANCGGNTIAIALSPSSRNDMVVMTAGGR
jgi:hypothetical protein